MMMDAFEKNILCRDQYRRVMSYLIISILVGLVLLIILGYQTIKPRKPVYYATLVTGQNIPLQSLDMPVVTNTYLLQWASLAVRAVYNLNFQGYNEELKEASSYFTPDGWNSVTKALQEAGVLDSIKDNKLFMAAVVDGPAVILHQSVIHGRHVWRVQLPLLVTYTSASEATKSHFIVTLDIMRVPVIDAAKSIQINQFSVV